LPSVDALPVGVYNITLVVVGYCGLTASDTVLVIVQEPPTTSTTTTGTTRGTSTTTGTTKTGIVIPGIPFALDMQTLVMVGAVVLIVASAVVARRRR